MDSSKARSFISVTFLYSYYFVSCGHPTQFQCLSVLLQLYSANNNEKMSLTHNQKFLLFDLEFELGFWLYVSQRENARLSAFLCRYSCTTDFPFQVLDADLFARLLIVLKPLAFRQIYAVEFGTDSKPVASQSPSGLYSTNSRPRQSNSRILMAFGGDAWG